MQSKSEFSNSQQLGGVVLDRKLIIKLKTTLVTQLLQYKANFYLLYVKFTCLFKQFTYL